MLGQLLDELQSIFNWLLSQLGWEGIQLTWIHWLLLALAVVGALVVVRNLIGGRSGGGGGYYPTYYPTSTRPKGLPTSYYVGSKRLGDFSIKPEVYDFRTPTSTPSLSELRKPINLDIEKASKLYMIPNPAKPVVDPQDRDTNCQTNSEEGCSAPKSAGPDWKLARKLFIPNLRRK